MNGNAVVASLLAAAATALALHAPELGAFLGLAAVLLGLSIVLDDPRDRRDARRRNRW